jgi:cytochrome c-type biogenesis protein CcmH
MSLLLCGLVCSALAQEIAVEPNAPVATEIGAPPDAMPTPETPPAADGALRAVDPAVLLGPPAGPALTGESLRQQTLATARLLRCVVCQGLSVADSPSETARAMRDEVEKLVAQGYDTDQVLTYFEASYGEFVRLEPRSDGFGLFVWVAPVVVLLGGGALVAASMRRGAPRADGFTRSAATVAGGDPSTPDDLPLADPDDPYLRRVREETA